MFSRVRIASFYLVILLLGPILQTASLLPAAAQRSPILPVIKADQLTKKQFDEKLKRLPDNAVIESKGKQFTVGEIRARAAQKFKETMAKAQVADRQAQAKFELYRAQFFSNEKARIDANNAKVLRFADLRQEGIDLWNRYKTASPAQRAQIENRASELLRQLQQLEREANVRPPIRIGR